MREEGRRRGRMRKEGERMRGCWDEGMLGI